MWKESGFLCGTNGGGSAAGVCHGGETQAACTLRPFGQRFKLGRRVSRINPAGELRLPRLPFCDFARYRWRSLSFSRRFSVRGFFSSYVSLYVFRIGSFFIIRFCATMTLMKPSGTSLPRQSKPQLLPTAFASLIRILNPPHCGFLTVKVEDCAGWGECRVSSFGRMDAANSSGADCHASGMKSKGSKHLR